MAKKKSEAKPHEKLLANRDNGYSKAKKGVV
jgi:hypothetical protein